MNDENKPKVVDINGEIEDKEMKEDKNNNPYVKFKINGITWNWFYSRDNNKEEIEETIKNLHKGDNVKGLGEETEGVYAGSPTTYHNIKNLEKVEIVEETVSEDTKEKDKEDAAIEVLNKVVKPEVNGAAFGLSCKLAEDVMMNRGKTFDKDEDWDTYSALVTAFLSKNQEIKEAL